MSRRKRIQVPQGQFEAAISSLSHEGRGICHVNDMPVFLDGGLPGEEVRFSYQRMHRRFAEGRVESLIKANAQRVEPRCQHALICGGCSLQHMSVEAQIKMKQDILLEQLVHFGKVKPQSIIEPLQKSAWGYRRKARLGVKYVDKKQKLMIGFREKHSNLLADITECHVLHPTVAALLQPLNELISQLSVMKQLPQIEVAVGDDATAMIFRHLESLTEEDTQLFINFAQQHDIHVYLQPGKMKSIYRLFPDDDTPERLHYFLPDLGLKYQFHPTDFIQVNADINQAMIARALSYMQLSADDTVLDLFCGLGNFTLPMATLAKKVVGVEGSEVMTERAQYNASLNQLSNVEFHAADLQKNCQQESWFQGKYNKLLIDPARSGAQSILEQLAQHSFERIVYVSCNPATLARDAGELVNNQGYTLVKAGVMDMFPHTNHVESIAVFEK